MEWPLMVPKLEAYFVEWRVADALEQRISSNFYDLVASNDIEAIRLQIAKGRVKTTFDFAQGWSYNALGIAIWCGCGAAVKALLDAGVFKVDDRVRSHKPSCADEGDNFGFSAIGAAIWVANEEHHGRNILTRPKGPPATTGMAMIELLLSYKPSWAQVCSLQPNNGVSDPKGTWRPLGYAIALADAKIVKTLIDHGAPLETYCGCSSGGAYQESMAEGPLQVSISLLATWLMEGSSVDDRIATLRTILQAAPQSACLRYSGSKWEQPLKVRIVRVFVVCTHFLLYKDGHYGQLSRRRATFVTRV